MIKKIFTLISTVFKRNCSYKIDFIYEKLIKLEQNNPKGKCCLSYSKKKP